MIVGKLKGIEKQFYGWNRCYRIKHNLIWCWEILTLITSPLSHQWASALGINLIFPFTKWHLVAKSEIYCAHYGMTNTIFTSAMVKFNKYIIIYIQTHTDRQTHTRIYKSLMLNLNILSMCLSAFGYLYNLHMNRYTFRTWKIESKGQCDVIRCNL